MSSGIEEESIVIAIIASFSSAKSKKKQKKRDFTVPRLRTHGRRLLSLNAMLYEVNVEIFH